MSYIEDQLYKNDYLKDTDVSDYVDKINRAKVIMNNHNITDFTVRCVVDIAGDNHGLYIVINSGTSNDIISLMQQYSTVQQQRFLAKLFNENIPIGKCTNLMNELFLGLKFKFDADNNVSIAGQALGLIENYPLAIKRKIFNFAKNVLDLPDRSYLQNFSSIEFDKSIVFKLPVLKDGQTRYNLINEDGILSTTEPQLIKTVELFNRYTELRELLNRLSTTKYNMLPGNFSIRVGDTIRPKFYFIQYKIYKDLIFNEELLKEFDNYKVLNTCSTLGIKLVNGNLRMDKYYTVEVEGTEISSI